MENKFQNYKNVMDGGDYSPTENSAKSPAGKNIPKQSIVRTYKSDTEEAIRIEHASSLSIALAEQKKKQEYQLIEDADRETNPAAALSSRKIFIFIISMLFVLAGIGAFNLNYIKEKVKPAPQDQPQIKSLITADSNKEINLDEIGGNDLNSLLSDSLKLAGAAENSIRNIYITENNKSAGKEKLPNKVISSKKFMSLINSRMPDSLLRSLKTEYMLGVHYSNGNHPFIILKTDSYENAFAGMLLWEKNMRADLSGLFSLNGESSSGEATATAPHVSAGNKDFEDVLVKNKDARVLKNSDDNVILIYSLFDKETVIIAANTDTLAELFDRIIRSRTIR
ncbi:MAG: hypothetical protein KGJ58_00445 [Patescibacteria group bacterium]|nr:hypothetical protein [Patescibacteria group bacterium]MDE1988761.1 hypothetical protein [Patescibacteria group bacterium]MDE2217911.1 hypothetical protein [Patescibacteria group bacterium]